jgi:hypothetical protein
MDSRLITIEEDTLNANVVKELIIQRLHDNGLLNDEQAIEYMEKWQVVIVKPTWFKRWMEKFMFTTNENRYIFKYVKFED